MIFDELKKLNLQIYDLYGDLHENRELLSKEQSEFMQQKLLENYEKEYELIMLQTCMERDIAIFSLRLLYDMKVPQYYRHWYTLFIKTRNKAAKLAEKRNKLHGKVYFEGEYRALEEEYSSAGTEVPALVGTSGTSRSPRTAIIIDDDTEDLSLRLLKAMFSENPEPRRFDFEELAQQLGTKPDNVRYNIKKLIENGYVLNLGEEGYAPSDKFIIF